MKTKLNRTKYFVGTKKLKNVKLFEEFLLESEEVDEALTPGQMRAQSGGKDLLNIGQAAVALVLAVELICDPRKGYSKDICKKMFEKYGSSNILMTEVFGNQWKSMDFEKWKKEVLLEAIRMKKTLSLSRATLKMAKMLSGDFSKDGNEVIYPLIEAYFKKLNAMDKEELVEFTTDFLKNPDEERFQAGYED